ncbi:flavocytochrome c, partial [Sutterella massiliensis]|nr:flavocytochrome c [Sutterella massiliensis]
MNESLPYKDLGTAALLEPGFGTYILFDEEMRRRQMKMRPNDAYLWRSIDEGRVPDYVFRGETLEEAAQKAGLEA